MNFTLVTTCYNEVNSLSRWRQDLASQTRQPDEIVIVDGESTDGTTEQLLEWAATEPRLKVHIEKCNVARGRNIAIEMASYDYILSTDMGVRLCSEWCEELIKPFERDRTIDVVAGSYQIDKETIKSAAARAEYYIENGGFAKLGPGFIPGNRSIAYTKKVWSDLGGLPEDLTLASDDSVFGRQIIQAGYKMAFAQKAMTYWGRPQRLCEFWKEKYNYGRGGGEALIKIPIAFRLYEKGFLPRFLVPAVTGFRHLTKKLTIKKILKAIRNGDFMAFLFMPILLFGNGYYFGKAYLIGDKWGKKHCLECRSRLGTTIPKKTQPEKSVK